MAQTLHTLILEDSQSDAVLLVYELRRGGFDVNDLYIDSLDALKHALAERDWDIILSDYHLPGFDALTAIATVKEQGLDIPIIVVAELADEDHAVAAMKAGASDFFSKDKLVRLVPAVERELREAAGRRQRHELETLFTTAFHGGPVGSVISRISDGTAIDVNARFLELFGYTREEILGKRSSELGIWRNQAQRQRLVKQLLETGSLRSAEIEVRKSGGIDGYALVSAEVIHIGGERCFLTMVHDISERKATEDALQRYTQRLQLLHEIDRAILRADSPASIAQSVLANLQTLMGYHSGSVTTVDEEYRYFTVLATAPPNLSMLPIGETRPVGNQAMRETLQRNEIHLINDLAQIPTRSPIEQALLESGIRTIIRIPLITRDRLLGGFIFHSEKTNAFTQEHIDIAREAAAQLAIALHSAQLRQKIEEHTLELEARVRERTLELEASEASLRLALAQEKELNELKTRFVSMVSHDFRTPLTIIQSNANLLESSFDKLDEAKKSRYFQRIYTQIRRMAGLLDAVLNFARADVGVNALNFVETDLDQFCSAIADEFQNMDSVKHNLIYSVDINNTHGPKPIAIDEKLLQQAIINLLTNAFKYSPEGSTVHFILAYEPDFICIRVKDSGIGIPQADQGHLFEMFHRASNVGAIAGTGLGLAIVKRAVEAHRGVVEVESSEGNGSTFTVKLPCPRT